RLQAPVHQAAIEVGGVAISRDRDGVRLRVLGREARREQPREILVVRCLRLRRRGAVRVSLNVQRLKSLSSLTGLSAAGTGTASRAAFASRGSRRSAIGPREWSSRRRGRLGGGVPRRERDLDIDRSIARRVREREVANGSRKTGGINRQPVRR